MSSTRPPFEERGKGGRDRYVPLSPTLLATLAARSPRLGNMMALQHWLWAIHLTCFGALVVWPYLYR